MGHPTLAALLSALPLACGGDAGPGADVTVRDSAGIRIVSNGPIRPDQRVWTVEQTPVLQIGTLDGEPEYQFFRVSGAHRFDDGRIVVANGGSHELRFYGANGEHYRSVGGEGDGPGEFQALGLLRALAGDSLLTFDQRQRRISVFDSTGAFVRSFAPRGVEFYRLLDAFVDGRILIQEFDLVGPDEIAEGSERRSVTYRVADREGATTATMGPYSGQEMQITPRSDMIFVNAVPFGRAAFASAVGERVVAGTNDAYALDVYGHDGALEGIIRLTHEFAPVRPGQFELLRDEALDRVGSGQGRQFETESWDAMPRHETFPAFRSFTSDTQGNLWVRDYLSPDDERSVWAVFDPEGTALGKVETPLGLRIFEIGEGYILGVMRDELDVEWLQLYALNKPAPLETQSSNPH
jgi:hypothetical protein